ncbi:conserved Plasmodium protein, unknown function [Plasmodium gallinaceum]|uniref:Uncharacterized protein n=1 Tax=Plasmodium gallinaceum TaxID=5849 RepID=A0A1J1H0P7_PLAGA|nr:conserved Plasmodium protein, unknown function [Plasmodium gallinaceum]CRG98021.1 conserved Plasmodium protein, unknown function [Plasmodium gallinaceum]
MYNNITDEEKKKGYFINTNKSDYVNEIKWNTNENSCKKKSLLNNSGLKKKKSDSTICNEGKNNTTSMCNNSNNTNKNDCDFYNSYVNVLYFKRLKINKKLFEKLKDKNIVIYLKYKDSTCASENIEVKNSEINNLFLCFLISEPFLKNEKNIIKIYIKYFKDDKYKILSFGFIELNYTDFSEKFYRKKTYMLCYDKNNNKYIFGYIIMIMANQKKWKICDNKIVYEYVKNSYFVCNKNNYDKQIFYICKKIQKNILESFNTNGINETRFLQNQTLLKHFSVTQSCPSTFSVKNSQKNINEENNINYKNYKSLIHFNNIKKPNYYIKECKLKNIIDDDKNKNKNNINEFEENLNCTNKNTIDCEENNILINSYNLKKENNIYSLSNVNPENHSKINLENIAKENFNQCEENKINSKQIKEDNITIHEGINNIKINNENSLNYDKNELNNYLGYKQSYMEKNDKHINGDKVNNPFTKNNFDFFLCEKLKNILNNDLDNFVKEMQFILKHLKKKIIKKNDYFINELKNKYKNEVEIKNKSAIECKKNGSEEVNNKEKCEQIKKQELNEEIEDDIIKILENCINTTSLYIKCVLKDGVINSYEKDIFIVYDDIINNMRKALHEYIRESKSLTNEDLNENKLTACLNNSNTNEKIVVKNKKDELSNDETNEMQTKIYDENCLTHSKTCFSSYEQNNVYSNINSDETLCSSSSFCAQSSIKHSRSLNENFKVNNYINQNISTALKYYEKKWKNKLLKMRNHL